MDIPVGDPFNFSFATVAACGGRYNALPSKFPSELRTKCRDTRDPAANNSTCLNPRNLQHTPRAHPRQLWKESIYSPLVRFRGVFQRCVETKLRLKVFTTQNEKHRLHGGFALYIRDCLQYTSWATGAISFTYIYIVSFERLSTPKILTSKRTKHIKHPQQTTRSYVQTKTTKERSNRNVLSVKHDQNQWNQTKMEKSHKTWTIAWLRPGFPFHGWFLTIPFSPRVRHIPDKNDLKWPLFDQWSWSLGKVLPSHKLT